MSVLGSNFLLADHPMLNPRRDGVSSSASLPSADTEECNIKGHFSSLTADS